MSLYDDFIKLTEDELAQKVNELVKNNQEEDQQIDFKRIDSLNFLIKGSNDRINKKESFSQDLSAFANAMGGIIIYGVEEQRNPSNGKREMIQFENGFDKSNFNKDQVIQIANTCIEPNLPGIDVKYYDHPNNPDQIIIIILIPETNVGAIMAVANDQDRRYYQRSGTENIKMRDFQVRLVNNKILHPNLELDFDLEKGIYFSFISQNKDDYQSYFSVKFPYIKNVGKLMAKEIALSIKITNKLASKIYNHEILDHFEVYNSNDSYLEKIKTYIHPLFPHMAINSLFESNEIVFRIDYSALTMTNELASKLHEITFTLYADNAKPKVYSIFLDLTNPKYYNHPEKLGLYPEPHAIKYNDEPYTVYISKIPQLLKFNYKL